MNTGASISAYQIEPTAKFPGSKLPVLIYRAAFNLPAQKNKAADIISQRFIRNHWSNTWRNGIYDYHHYHSNTHECLGIAMGDVHVLLGGPRGKRYHLKQGDVMILPAGVAHKCIRASARFLCVGAYPNGKAFDICNGADEDIHVMKARIEKVKLPLHDPVYNNNEIIELYWAAL